MKRNGSILLKSKKKKRLEPQSDEEEEEDQLSSNESDEAGPEHENQDEDLADEESDLEHGSGEDDNLEEGSNEEEERDVSGDETGEADDAASEGAEECSEQDEKGNEDEEPTPRKKVQRVTPLLKKKQRKAGVIYISTIPRNMNVTILRSLLEPFGDLGRVYLQPAKKDGQVRTKTASGKRAIVQYTEGWVEFLDKRVAKAVVPMLNMQPITNKKKSVFRDIFWNMKYLSGFKWVHLNERLTYERAVAKERMREQIQQIRKEASYHETKVHHKEMALKNAAREKKEKKSKAQ